MQAPTLSIAKLCSSFYGKASKATGLVSEDGFRRLLIGVGVEESEAKDATENVMEGRETKKASFQDFCQAYVSTGGRKPLLSIQRQFEIMDTDFDGKLSIKEMRKHFNDEYEQLDSEAKVANIFASMDRDSNGWIYFEELKEWYNDKPETKPEGIPLPDNPYGAMDIEFETKEGKKTIVAPIKEPPQKDNSQTPEDWTVDDVCAWIGKKSSRFGIQVATIENLRQEECDGPTFLELDKEMLKAMGLSVGQANAVMSSIAHLRKDGPGIGWKGRGVVRGVSSGGGIKLVKHPRDLEMRQILMTIAHHIMVSTDSKDKETFKYLADILAKIAKFPDQKAYRSLCKDYVYPLIGIRHQDFVMPMTIELFLKNMEMTHKIEGVVSKGYKDVEYLVFLYNGMEDHEWMAREFKDVLKSLDFSQYDIQITKKQLKKLGKSYGKFTAKSGSKFEIGQEVEYKSRTRGDWHEAIVQNVRDDGSCLVKLRAGAVKIASPNMLRHLTQLPNVKPEDKPKSSADRNSKEKKSTPNSKVGELVVKILRGLGFEEDDETGFWLLLDRKRVPVAVELNKEIKEISTSPARFLKTHTTVQELKKQEEEEEVPDGETAQIPELERQVHVPSLYHLVTSAVTQLSHL
ncbi:hypothetical protein AAMO2058_000291100 [Amorphochlora amoebiformis]